MSKQITVKEDVIQHFIDEVDEAGIGIEEEDAACTNVTLDEFRAQWGEEAYTDGDLFVWRNIQTAKGRRRGDLFVMDVDGGTVSYFSGESL